MPNLVVYCRQVLSSQPVSDFLQLRISRSQPHQTVISLDQQVGAIKRAFQLYSPFTFGLLPAQRLCALVFHTFRTRSHKVFLLGLSSFA